MNDDLPEWMVRQPDPSDPEGHERWLKFKARLEESDRQLKIGEYTEYDTQSFRRFFDDLIERALRRAGHPASGPDDENDIASSGS